MSGSAIELTWWLALVGWLALVEWNYPGSACPLRTRFGYVLSESAMGLVAVAMVRYLPAWDAMVGVVALGAVAPVAYRCLPETGARRAAVAVHLTACAALLGISPLITGLLPVQDARLLAYITLALVLLPWALGYALLQRSWGTTAVCLAMVAIGLRVRFHWWLGDLLGSVGILGRRDMGGR